MLISYSCFAGHFLFILFACMQSQGSDGTSTVAVPCPQGQGSLRGDGSAALPVGLGHQRRLSYSVLGKPSDLGIFLARSGLLTPRTFVIALSPSVQNHRGEG